MHPYFSLQGRTALVTGGTRGIGKMIAKAFVEAGATVYVCARDAQACAQTALELSAHGTCHGIAANLATEEGVQQLAATLGERIGQLDILVNNAGNAGWVGFNDATPDSWDTLIAVYARAPFFIVQAALSRLADGGRIINISSAAATKPVTAAPIYSMAKAAINNLTHALASELGPRGITANAVAPGFTRTDANAAFRENPELVKAIEAQIALGRFGEPSEIAAVVAFLASDDGHWVTGQTIEASGGYRL